MNDTYELYKNGGNLVDQCNAEMEAELPLAERASKVPASQEYIDFCLNLAEQCKGIVRADRERHESLKATLARASKCQDAITAGDVDLLYRVADIATSRAKTNVELIDISIHLMQKVSRAPKGNK